MWIDASELMGNLLAFGNALGKSTEAQFEKLAAEVIERTTSRYWTNRTGKTAKSTKSRRYGSFRRVVTVFAKHGSYLDQGTKPHIIRPVNAKALRFVQGGSVRFAKFVRHPGTKPMDFVRKERAHVESMLAYRGGQAVDAAFRSSGL